MKTALWLVMVLLHLCLAQKEQTLKETQDWIVRTINAYGGYNIIYLDHEGRETKRCPSYGYYFV